MKAAPEPRPFEETDLIEHYEVWAEVFGKVLNKRGRLVPFEFNRMQRELDAVVSDQLERRGYVRLLVLKGRQQGASLWIIGRGYKQTTQHTGWRTLIIAHEAPATAKLFGYVKRFHANMPERFQPSTKKSNAIELEFDELDSSYRLVTAGTPDSGRSETVQFFHGSEVASWKHGKEILEGAFQALVSEDDSEGYLETTAKGRTGTFWKLWDLARKAKRGDIDPATGQPYVAEWESLFIPWFWTDEYRAPVPPGFKPSPAEALLAKRYGLDNRQLQWRRQKISEFGGGEEGELSFRQEYPCNDEEAFLLSGRKYFSLRRIEKMVLTAREPKERGILEQSGKTVRFIETDDGWLEVWARPVKGIHYAVGGDVSEGTVRGDQHSCHVLQRGPLLRQVARMAPHVDADEYGRRMVLVATWYNGSWMAPERNNTQGGACVQAAVATKYPRIFRAETVDEESGRPLKKFGWLTTSASRPIMLQHLQQLVRDGGIVVESPVTAGQIETFVVNDAGKPEAADDCLDDEVLALAIAAQVVLRTEPDDEGVDLAGDKIADGPPLRSIKTRQDWG